MDKKKSNKQTTGITSRIVASNRNARRNYEVLEKNEAGICLRGTEIKAIRKGKINLDGAYGMFSKNELWLNHLYIGEYDHGSDANHIPFRRRKMLLSRRELKKWFRASQATGCTIVPIDAHFRGSLIKIELALVRGRQSHDKRQLLKKRDTDREMQRALRDKG